MQAPGQEIFLDVSDLPPPEPLEKALAALPGIPAAGWLRMVHRCEPCLLYPELRNQGFSHRIFHARDGMVTLLIWRSTDELAAAGVQTASARLESAGKC